jgi:hypothetical protein
MVIDSSPQRWALGYEDDTRWEGVSVMERELRSENSTEIEIQRTEKPIKWTAI